MPSSAKRSRPSGFLRPSGRPTPQLTPRPIPAGWISRIRSRHQPKKGKNMRTLRNVFRRKLRAFLTIFGITIGVFALVVMGGMAEKINLLVDGGVRFYGDKVTVSAEGSGMLGGGYLSTEKLAEIEAVDGVTAASADISMLLDSEGGMSFGMPAMIMGTDQRGVGYESFELTLQEGRDFTPEERGVAVVGSDLVEQLDAEVGGTITLRGREFQVLGIWDKTLTAPDTTVAIPLADAQEIFLAEQPDMVRDNLEADRLATGLTVYLEPGGEPVGFEIVPDHIRLLSQEDLLSVGQRDGDGRVRSRQGLVPDPQHLELPATQGDRAAELGVQLLHQVAADHSHAPLFGSEVTALLQGQLEALITDAALIGAHDHGRHAEAHAPFAVEEHADVGRGGGHAVDRFDLGKLFGGQVAPAQHARPLRADGDLVPVEANPAVHQQVDLLGHSAHHHEGKDADGDSEDGEKGAQFAPKYVTQSSHVLPLFRLMPAANPRYPSGRDGSWRELWRGPAGWPQEAARAAPLC